MNRITGKWLAIVALTLIVCTLLVGCNDNPAPTPDEHKHTYDTSKWMTDEDNHWHAASCEHSDERIDAGEHIDDDENEICDVCEYVLHKHAYNTEQWTTDETSHWHASTCGCEDEKLDAGEHADADINAVCDVCGYEIHYHEYDTENWQNDADSHWHGTTCGHDDKVDVAEHTKDFLGTCTTCGYNSAKSIVGVAIDLGTAAKDNVKQGTLTSSEGTVNYEFRNGYLYVHSIGTMGFKETYTALSGSEVFSVIYESSTSDKGDVFTEIRRDTLATELNLLGPSVPTAFLNYDYSFYGAEDLISGLHTLAFVDNTNRDYAEDVDEGVYSFSFGYYSDSYGLYKISTSFTLDEATNAVLSVSITARLYSNSEDNCAVEKLTEANPEENIPETWGVIPGAKASATYTVTLEQSTTPSENHETPNPYSPDSCMIKDFYLAYSDGTAVEGTIELKKSNEMLLYIVSTDPEGADMTFSTYAVSGDKVNVEFDFSNLDPWRQSLQIYYTDGNFIKINSQATPGSTFTFNIAINGVVKTYTVTVV